MKTPSHLEQRTSEGKKLCSPSSERNKDAIGNILSKSLIDNAKVLEIASGTGQHGDHICRIRPDICWQYSDIDADALDSQQAYAADLLDHLMAPLRIDTAQGNWWRDIQGIDAIYCANMIHIAPWEAALGLAKGAGAILPKNGRIYLYGPFLLEDRSAPSNIQFDISLKQRNPHWGVRNLTSVKHIFADEGLSFQQAVGMPRDNYLLVFKRS